MVNHTGGILQLRPILIKTWVRIPKSLGTLGTYLISLKNIQDFYGSSSSFATRINNIVYVRTNYEPEAQVAATLVANNFPNDVYHYYLALGFASFFDNRPWSDGFIANYTAEAKTILNNILILLRFPCGCHPYGGVTLPKADILCEPLLLAIFSQHQPDPALLSFSKQVYLVQEARYNATSKVHSV